MKDFKQLKEDLRTNEELAKKFEEAEKQLKQSRDKAGFIKAAADLGYEITEQDFSGNEELVKLDEKELDNVAGGFFGFYQDAEDDHEVGCAIYYYHGAESSVCPNSPSAKHRFTCIGSEYDTRTYKCDFCGCEVWA